MLSLTGAKIPIKVDLPLKSYAKCIKEPNKKIKGIPRRNQI
jgi:hypothetical protein